MTRIINTSWVLLFFLLITTFKLFAAEDLLEGQWRGTLGAAQYRIGDDPLWAKTDIDRSPWKSFDQTLLIEYDGIYWLRFEMQIEAKGEIFKSHKLAYDGLAAFEFYFDGHLIEKNGVVGASRNEEVPGLRRGEAIVPQNLLTNGSHVLAFRISSHHWHKRDPLYRPHNKLINSITSVIEFEDRIEHQFAVGFLAVNLFLSIYYLILYFGDRKNQTHLIYSLLCFSLFSLGVSQNLPWLVALPYNWDYTRFWILVISVTFTINLLPSVFLSQFKTDNKTVWFGLFLVYWISCLIWVNKQVVGNWIVLGSFAGSMLICLDALRRKQNLTWYSTFGLLVCAIAFWIDEKYFYFGFTLLSLSLLIGITLKDREQRELFHLSNLQASQFEAQLLRQNIQPHFLMNSLTTILEWVEVEPEKAGVFIELLADEFRLFSEISQQQIILVEQEVQLCRIHMEVMGFRLQKKFTLELEDVDLHRQIPPAVFHTLVENGISHNSYQKDEVSFILRQHWIENALTYTMITPLATDHHTRQSYTALGTGSKYIQSRLAQCFGDRWQLESYQQDEYWITNIILRI